MRSRSVAWIAAAVVAVVAGCASAPPGPEGWLPAAQEVPASPYGGWIEVEYVAADAERHRVEGELLAIQGGNLCLVDAGTPRCVPLDSVTTAKLGYYDPNASAIGEIAFFGVLSTISNGGFLILTAPAWIVVGAGASASRAGEATLKSKYADWDEFRMYARFPRGMPSGFVPGADLQPLFETPPPAQPVAGRAALAPPRDKAVWMDLGAGFGGVGNASSGVSFLGGVNLGYKWFMVGTRVSSVEWDLEAVLAYGSGYDNGRLYDLPLLLGLRGNFGLIHATVSAGPAAFARSFGDLFDFEGSTAAQGELLVFATDNFGFGAMVGYNWNNLADYYVVCLGIAIGNR
jgi:hypothetical protein